MRENIPLATPLPLTSSNGFDFFTFLKCKPYLAPKDERIIALIVQKILGVLDQNQEVLRLLDVGSGDATVIGQICRLLSSHLYRGPDSNLRVTADCVEPCPEGIQLVRQIAVKISSSQILMTPRYTTIENFLVNGAAGYNMIVCCHALYHIECAKWKHILRGLISALQDGGVLIVNLVSRQSDIYRIKDKIERIDGFRTLPKMYGSYGFEYYAEDLEDLLPQLGDTWEQEVISANILFSREDVYEAIKELQGSGNDSLLLEFLAFMFRLRYDDLLATGKARLLELLMPASDGIAFNSIDKMFVFRRRSIR